MREFVCLVEPCDDDDNDEPESVFACVPIKFPPALECERDPFCVAPILAAIL